MSEYLKKVAQDALDVQDACNLCAVVQSFARATLVVRENTNGTEEANQHPVAVLFTAKLMQLTGIGARADCTMFARAYDECAELAR